MPVHVIHYAHQGRNQWGVVRNETITPIVGDFPTTAKLVEYASNHDLSALHGDPVERSKVKLLSPVTRNQQLICLGANYRSHMVESGVDPDAKKFNMVFRKASSCIVPADSDVVRPNHVALLDYEVELGLVIRRDITEPLTVTDDNLHELIAGVTIVNDYSARDVQLPQMQFYKGKSYRTFGPVGPYLCLLAQEDMPYLRDLRLKLRVNGEVRQDASTSELVFRPAETLTELSGIQDLHAGDLIATGTPAGCALRVPPPRVQRIAALLPEATRWRLFLRTQMKRPQYLKPGDVVESSVASADEVINLGVQRNRIV
ncbi:MAG: fumarylacetoacetate hydrolase family protein [Polyangiales bacterium]|jgi:2-keto-4-pentenoate hydratase/2-oxohepta-3-ene-1,7-dioic acid hydratase in catechol pathway